MVVTLDWEGDSSVEVGGFDCGEVGVDAVPEALLTVNVETHLEFT